MDKVTNSKQMNKTTKIVFIALLVAQALVLSIIERMIPLNFMIPGAKLGLANIVTLTSIYLFDFKESLLLVILRTFLTAFLIGSMSSFLYSFSGAMVSFLVMFMMVRYGKDKVSTIVVSVVGGVTHNLGQLLMAGLIIHNFRIVYYLPFLTLTGIWTGIFVGICVVYLVKALRNTKYFR